MLNRKLWILSVVGQDGAGDGGGVDQGGGGSGDGVVHGHRGGLHLNRLHLHGLQGGVGDSRGGSVGDDGGGHMLDHGDGLADGINES